jgi:hypothetical protein
MRVNSDQIVEGPIWQPLVWRDGPDLLVAQARSELFGEQRELDGALRTGAGGGYPDNISGGGTAPMNEGEQLISTRPGPTSDVKGEWDQCMKDMRGAEPLAEAHVNPAP